MAVTQNSHLGFSIEFKSHKQDLVRALNCRSESGDLNPEYLDALVQVRVCQKLTYWLHYLANKGTKTSCGSILGASSENEIG